MFPGCSCPIGTIGSGSFGGICCSLCGSCDHHVRKGEGEALKYIHRFMLVCVCVCVCVYVHECVGWYIDFLAHHTL